MCSWKVSLKALKALSMSTSSNTTAATALCADSQS